MRARQDPVTIPGVNVLRWELGNALRDLRIAARMTVGQAASALECSDAKISRLENGQRGAIARDVRDLCDLYGVPAPRREELMTMSRESRSVDRRNPSTIPAKLQTFLALESTAVTMRCFEATLVPGLLQTQEYARALIRSQPAFSAAEVEERVMLRMERQRRLTSRFRPIQAHFIIDENVLWRPIGSPAERERQLARLVELARLPNVTLQVIPYDAGAYLGMEASTVTLLGFEDGAKQTMTCYLEGLYSELFLRGHSEIDTFSKTFDRMKEVALDPVKSCALVMRIASGRYRHWSIRAPEPKSNVRLVKTPSGSRRGTT
jgi:transcriptional regulator with XRE-family HTH domain